MGCAGSTKASQSAPSMPAMEFATNASLAELLGPKLLTRSREAETMEVIAGKPVVALYFSAHWCPPCRSFTPKFANWYTENLKAKGLEVVFVSSDRDAASFNDYFKEMPWLALPFGDQARKEALSKRFKVQGIPTIVILDADGKIITKDGREAISADCTGEDFPWRPKSFKEVMAGAMLVNQEGEELEAATLEGKTLGLYFSAHWCPPCRGFTPQLVEWYKKNLKAKGLEVVFISSDRDEASFQEYFKEMPWTALCFSDRKRKEQLSSLFGVNGIPSLVVVGPDGATITKDGRAAVAGDPEGLEFPWHPKPVVDLKFGPGNLNEVPTVIALCEGCHPSTQASTVEAMTSLAQQYLDKQKVDGEEEPAIAFKIATEAGGLAGRFRELAQLPKDAGSEALLILFDIADDGAFYTVPKGEITSTVVARFVAGYEAKALKRQQLARPKH